VEVYFWWEVFSDCLGRRLRFLFLDLIYRLCVGDGSCVIKILVSLGFAQYFSFKFKFGCLGELFFEDDLFTYFYLSRYY